MKKRYQVFVSSTFIDLKEERQEVMQALLELNCIPAGMELFPAANEDQWSLIKKVIEDSDYYLVVLAGRYGSIGPEGYSYTEMEYRYALELGKPVIGFVHGNTGNILSKWVEPSAEGKEKLAAFQSLVQTKICKFWENPSDLGGKVSRSLIRLINDFPAVGWVRGDQVPPESSAEEVLKLHRRIEELEELQENFRLEAPVGSESLAKGTSTFLMSYTFSVMAQGSISYRSSHDDTARMTWDKIFYKLGPALLNECTNYQLSKELGESIREEFSQVLIEKYDLGNSSLYDFIVSKEDIITIVIQFRALGYIKSCDTKNDNSRAVGWELTPYGDTIMTRLRAIRADE